MSQYLLSTHAGQSTGQGDGQEMSMTPEDMQGFMKRVIDLEAEMEASGTFVFGGRLADPDASTVIRAGEGDPVMTDGPFIESKEHVAGFYIINAEDLDAALAWASKVVAAIGAPIEVRPFFASGRVVDQMGEMPSA